MEISQKKLTCPYEDFNITDDFQKPVDNLKKEDIFNNLRDNCIDKNEIQRTKQIFEILNNKSGEQLTR